MRARGAVALALALALAPVPRARVSRTPSGRVPGAARTHAPGACVSPRQTQGACAARTSALTRSHAASQVQNMDPAEMQARLAHAQAVMSSMSFDQLRSHPEIAMVLRPSRRLLPRPR